jgi:hypothetical protein
MHVCACRFSGLEVSTHTFCCALLILCSAHSSKKKGGGCPRRAVPVLECMMHALCCVLFSGVCVVCWMSHVSGVPCVCVAVRLL